MMSEEVLISLFGFYPDTFAKWLLADKSLLMKCLVRHGFTGITDQIVTDTVIALMIDKGWKGCDSLYDSLSRDHWLHLMLKLKSDGKLNMVVPLLSSECNDRIKYEIILHGDLLPSSDIDPSAYINYVINTYTFNTFSAKQYKKLKAVGCVLVREQPDYHRFWRLYRKNMDLANVADEIILDMLKKGGHRADIMKLLMSRSIPLKIDKISAKILSEKELIKLLDTGHAVCSSDYGEWTVPRGVITHYQKREMAQCDSCHVPILPGTDGSCEHVVLHIRCAADKGCQFCLVNRMTD